MIQTGKQHGFARHGFDSYVGVNIPRFAGHVVLVDILLDAMPRCSVGR